MTTDNLRTKKHNSRGRTPEGEPNPVDVHVGKRIRLRREVLRLSQEKLAAMLGLTFQQVQKYEKGMNRIGASRLYDVSQTLGVPITYFYDEMSEETASQSPRKFIVTDDIVTDVFQEIDDPMQKTEAIRLIKAYNKIPNRQTAEALYTLVLKMSVTSANLNQDEPSKKEF